MPGHDISVESFSTEPASLAAAINCFNLGGTRFNGTKFDQPMQVMSLFRMNSIAFGLFWPESGPSCSPVLKIMELLTDTLY